MSKLISQSASVVPIETLRPNPWNPNVQSEFIFARERASIREFGFVDPVTVREVPGADGLEIVDGEHRWRAAREEGFTDIAVVNLGVIPDHVAKRLTVVLNGTRGEADTTKLSELIHELAQEGPELLAVLPFTEQELKRYLDLATFDLSVLDNPPQSPSTDGGDLPETRVRLKLDLSPEGLGVVERAIAVSRAQSAHESDAAALVAICGEYLSRLSAEAAALAQSAESTKKKPRRARQTQEGS